MDDLLDQAAPARSRPRSRISPALIISIVLHLLFAGAAALYVVSRYSNARELTFRAGPKSPNPSEQALQHRVQLQQKKSTQSLLASVPRRILTTGAAKVELPAMPDLPKAKEGPPTLAAATAGNFGATCAAPAGALGGNGVGPAINFFGIRDLSSSVVIMIDVSDSMFTRTGDAEKSKLLKLGHEQSFQAVRDEAIKLIQGLGANIRFGIIRWSGGAYSWKPELVPATDENKAAAIAHIETEVNFHRAKKKPDRPGGTRHDYALEEAFKLQPETIYMITDGNATGESSVDPSRKISAEDIFHVADESQKTLRKRARLHAIYYLTGADKPEERQLLMTLSSRNGGKFQQVAAKGRRKQ